MAGVDFVSHAAALKEVPSYEFFPMEAARGADCLVIFVEHDVVLRELASAESNWRRRCARRGCCASTPRDGLGGAARSGPPAAPHDRAHRLPNPVV